MFASGAALVVVLAVLGQSGWTAGGGRESFSFRDVARGGPPADASPVEWTGSGPSLNRSFAARSGATSPRYSAMATERSRVASG